MNRRIALVTCEQFPTLSDDDRLLQQALGARGLSGTPVVWTEPSPDWSAFDLAMIRSTWDYHRRFPDFQRWIDETAPRVPLWNPPTLLRWNMRKTYLRDLAGNGVPTVPTEWGAAPTDLARAAASHQWRRVVVKPSVSANAERTHLLDSPDAISALALDDRGTDGWMVQPYLDEVEGRGERSLVFLGGEYSHAAQRKAALNPTVPLVDGTAVTATAGERETAGRALAAVRDPWLYARVDLVTTRDGVARVMELEMIEPFLYLRAAPGAAARLAELVERRIS